MEENNYNPLDPEIVQDHREEEATDDAIPEGFNGDEINTKVDEIIANQTISNSDKLREIVWNTCLKLYKDDVEYDIADVVDTVKTYLSHSKIELLHDKVTLDNQKAAVEFIDSAIISSEGLAGASNSLQSLADGSFFDNLMSEYTSDSDKAAVNEISNFATKIQLDENNEQIEIKKLQKELHQTVAISDIAYQLVMADYRAEHGDTSIYDDVLEKLYKDKDTLSKSTNINAANRIKNIDAVIEALDESKRLELIDYVKPKLNNVKALVELLDMAVIAVHRVTASHGNLLPVHLVVQGVRMALTGIVLPARSTSGGTCYGIVDTVFKSHGAYSLQAVVCNNVVAEHIQILLDHRAEVLAQSLNVLDKVGIDVSLEATYAIVVLDEATTGSLLHHVEHVLAVTHTVQEGSQSSQVLCCTAQVE